MPSDPDLTAALVGWFRRAARDLPWRTTPRDPYAVLVSEAMLQQTQVDRVAPRFGAFLARFPDVASLAAAGEAEVVAAWSGLGYYRRARLLHAAAGAVVAGGGFPRDVAGLRALPGVGPYTAAAIASLAFGVAAPVLDGNVVRVAARVLAYPGDPRSAAGARRLAAWVEGALLAHHDRPGEVNEALMELGATVCRPRAPACPSCPLAPGCRARAAGTPENHPPPRRGRATESQRWVAAICVDPAGRWLLREVVDGPVLRGLWLPPLDTAGAASDEARARALVLGAESFCVTVLPPVRHGITFRRIEVVPVVLRLHNAPAAGALPGLWARPDAPGRPTSSLLAKLASRVTEAAPEAP